MLIGLTKTLKVGDSINITFSFEKAPSQTIAFPVIAAKTPSDSEEHQH
jgi:copper(I)-binding protein